MRPTGSKEIRCPACRYRAAPTAGYLCEYAGITGHTRGAAPPERCKHFEPGKSLAGTRGEKPKGRPICINPVRRRTRYDWEKAKRIYDQKWSDPKIADAMGCRVQSVREWRKREKLPAWPRSVQVMARKAAVT